MPLYGSFLQNLGDPTYKSPREVSLHGTLGHNRPGQGHG